MSSEVERKIGSLALRYVTMAAIHTILHPTDLSESAKPLLRLAARLAQDHGARLIALHATAPPVVYGEFGMTIPVPEMDRELLEADRIKLEGFAAGSGAECRVVQGLAAPEILRVAREEPCDLILMGTHARGGVTRVLLGSVATDVLRQAPCPVLAIKPQAAPEMPGEEEAAAGPGPGTAAPPLFPVILHPTDFSERSRHAFDVACTLARGGGRLIVLHVVEAVHIASEGYEDALNERLRGFQPVDPTIRVEYRLRSGESAEEILREAAASACAVIALGTHGRAGLDRLLMGSVAEAVLRRAGCPVLVVKAPAPVPAPDTSGSRSKVIF
jgi:nucleotide-binding universal stress UspA family protein